MLALIPARKGSKRLEGKNMRLLQGRPLIDFTLKAAFDSECFSKVVVSSDWHEVLEYAASWYGAETIVRPAHLATDESLDVDWVKHALGTLAYRAEDKKCAYFTDVGPLNCDNHVSGLLDEDLCILRLTSPFRDAECIERAKVQWAAIGKHYDSMRAVRRASETGWKMWTSNQLESALTPQDFEIEPLTSAAARKHLHSRPTQSLTPCYIQTAGLEMCWTATVLEKGSIAGDRVAGFLMQGPESLDINDESDWEQAERLVDRVFSQAQDP